MDLRAQIVEAERRLRDAGQRSRELETARRAMRTRHRAAMIRAAAEERAAQDLLFVADVVLVVVSDLEARGRVLDAIADEVALVVAGDRA